MNPKSISIPAHESMFRLTQDCKTQMAACSLLKTSQFRTSASSTSIGKKPFSFQAKLFSGFKGVQKWSYILFHVIFLDKRLRNKVRQLKNIHLSNIHSSCCSQQVLIREHYLDNRNLNRSMISLMGITRSSLRPGRSDAITWHNLYKVLLTIW